MKARYLTLFIVILIVAGIIGYALSSGLSIHQWLVLATPLVAWILLGIWYAIWGWGNWKTRLKVSGSLFVVLFLVAGGIRYLTRYEGSTSGASLPKLVWKWSSREIEGIETRVNASAVDQTIEEEAASVSTNFLGPNRDGMWDKVPFSMDWNSIPPVELWRRPVGPAWSSFAVSGGKAITLEQINDDELALCLDLLSGREIWRQLDTGVNFVKSKEGAAGALMGGKGPRSTPTIFRDRVYVMGSTGNAKCLELETGNFLWQRNVITDYQGLIPKWGKSNSPLILEDEGLVVVTGSEIKGVSIIALDLATGETKWTYETNGASYSSPTILTLLGTRQIVSVNATDVCGLDPGTGKELWQHKWKRSDPKVCQPLPVSENRILVTASYGAGSPLIELKKDGDIWLTSEVWKSPRMKTKFSSAVIIDQHAYGIDEGRLAAIDLATGNKAWKREKYGFGQQLLVEDHLIIQTEPGDVVLGIPTPEQFTETYRLKALSSMTWNTPALAGRFLLVRNDREAICFLLPEKT
jgi:outer membrane protein assembly factor BamB